VPSGSAMYSVAASGYTPITGASAASVPSGAYNTGASAASVPSGAYNTGAAAASMPYVVPASVRASSVVPNAVPSLAGAASVPNTGVAANAGVTANTVTNANAVGAASVPGTQTSASSSNAILSTLPTGTFVPFQFDPLSVGNWNNELPINDALVHQEIGIANYTDTGLQEQAIQQFQNLDFGIEDPTINYVGSDPNTNFNNPFTPGTIPADDGSGDSGGFLNPISVGFGSSVRSSSSASSASASSVGLMSGVSITGQVGLVGDTPWTSGSVSARST